MEAFGAQVYLTGQGGWLSRDEFQTISSATRAMLAGAAAAMQEGSTGDLPLAQPVGPALRSFVDSIGGKVTQTLGAAYPGLKTLPVGSGNVGELGVSFCSAQSPDAARCQVR
jgi:hypothetical protein